MINEVFLSIFIAGVLLALISLFVNRFLLRISAIIGLCIVMLMREDGIYSAQRALADKIRTGEIVSFPVK